MINKKFTRWLVITDLDGTLLNHHDYATDMAVPAIQKLQSLEIPIIFNTSKTFSESASIQKYLNIQAPFIVENGSCIYIPKNLHSQKTINKPYHSREEYWEFLLGMTHENISNILNKIDTPESYYQLLSKCNAEEASKLTGLNISQAEQAISREFSEPLIWKASDKALTIFKNQLHGYNLNTLQGGRFLHVLGNCDKGIATNKLKELLSAPDKNFKTIVLGDSENDAAMLLQSDISIIINSPSNHQLLNIVTPTLQSKNQAPEGWAESIYTALNIIKELE